MRKLFKKIFGGSHKEPVDVSPAPRDEELYRKKKTPKRAENRKIATIVAEGFVEEKLTEITDLLNESDTVFLSEAYLSVNKDCWQDIATVLIENDFCDEAKVGNDGIECVRKGEK